MLRPVAVLYRDDDLIAVSKPSGVIIHRGLGRDRQTLLDLLRTQCGCGRLFPVHRLDRQTSGVTLLALNRTSARELGQQISHRQVVKLYVALVRGEPPLSGAIERPIPCGPGGNRADARTDFQLLAVAKSEPRTVSLVLARPITGRMHQIRRHLKAIDHPVLGDSNYGRGELNRAFAARYGLSRLALHAAALAFWHPRTLEPLAVSAPLPEDLAAPLEKMGFAPQLVLELESSCRARALHLLHARAPLEQAAEVEASPSALIEGLP